MGESMMSEIADCGVRPVCAAPARCRVTRRARRALGEYFLHTRSRRATTFC
jgi:hypothetical protein